MTFPVSRRQCYDAYTSVSPGNLTSILFYYASFHISSSFIKYKTFLDSEKAASFITRKCCLKNQVWRILILINFLGSKLLEICLLMGACCHSIYYSINSIDFSFRSFVSSSSFSYNLYLQYSSFCLVRELFFFHYFQACL